MLTTSNSASRRCLAVFASLRVGLARVRAGSTLAVAAAVSAIMVSTPASVALGQTAFEGPTNYPAGGVTPSPGGPNTTTSSALADFNGDGDPDLAITNLISFRGDNTVSVLLGGPGASFGSPTSYSFPGYPNSVAVGDFNGDSDPDLVVALVLARRVAVLLGGEGGTFRPATTFDAGGYAESVGIGDFNDDSDPDLAVANSARFGQYGNITMLLGGAGGSFGPPTSLTPGGSFGAPTSPTAGASHNSIAIGDFNGDSDPDLVATDSVPIDGSGAGSATVLLGRAGASFGEPTRYRVGFAPGLVALGDFNGDSDPDLAVLNTGGVRGPGAGSISVLLGGEGGSFGAAQDLPVPGYLGSVAIADFNGDSDPDLAVTDRGSADSSAPGRVLVLLGGPGGSFGPPQSFALGTSPTSMVAGDFNPRSLPDLAVTGGSLLSVLLNVTDPQPPGRPRPTPGNTDSGAPVVGAAPEGAALAAIQHALRRDARAAAVALRRRGIRKLLKSGGFSIGFHATRPGRLTVKATAVGRLSARGRKRRFTVAQSRRVFSAPGSYRVRVRLTRAGRLFLGRARRAELTLRLGFRHASVRARSTERVTVRRLPASPRARGPFRGDRAR